MRLEGVLSSFLPFLLLLVGNFSGIECICSARLYRSADGRSVKVEFVENKYAFVDIAKESQSPSRLFLVHNEIVRYYPTDEEVLHVGNLADFVNPPESTALSNSFMNFVSAFEGVPPAYTFEKGILTIDEALKGNFHHEELPVQGLRIIDPESNFRFVVNGKREFIFHAFRVPYTELVVRIGGKNRLLVTSNISKFFLSDDLGQSSSATGVQEEDIGQPEPPEMPVAPESPASLPIQSPRRNTIDPIGPRSSENSQSSDELKDQPQSGWRPFDPKSWTPFH